MIARGERKDRLTTVDDFAEHRRAVGGRAIPATVPELPLALLDGGVDAGGDRVEDARVLPDEPALAATQQRQAGLQNQLDVLGVGEEVTGGRHVHDAPDRAQVRGRAVKTLDITCDCIK